MANYLLNWLTLDCTGFNPNGPGRFGTKAENPDMQTCYFNVIDDDYMYNVFVGKRKRIYNNAHDNEIYFEIEGIKSQTNIKTFNAELESNNLYENGARNAGSLLANLFLNQQEIQLEQNF